MTQQRRGRGRPRRNIAETQVEEAIAFAVSILHLRMGVKLKIAAHEVHQRALAFSKEGEAPWNLAQQPALAELLEKSPKQRAALRAMFRRVSPSRAEKAFLRYRRHLRSELSKAAVEVRETDG